jgi:hypothetical protein
MPKYLVTVMRRAIGTAEIEIEAKNPGTAKQSALRQAYSECFNMFDAEYIVEDCSEVKPSENLNT